MPFVQDTLRELVGRIVVKTTAGNVTIDDPFAPSASAEPSFASRLLKPALDVYARGQDTPLFSSSPYGTPTNYGPTVAVALGLGVGWLAWRAFGRR